MHQINKNANAAGPFKSNGIEPRNIASTKHLYNPLPRIAG